MTVKLKIPTFQQLLTEYPKIAKMERMKCERPCKSTVSNVISGVRAICRTENVAVTDSIDCLTRSKIDAYLATATERGQSAVTAWTYVLHLCGITARWTRPYYESRGWKVDSFDIPCCRRRSLRYRRPERKDLLKVKTWYDSLTIRTDPRDWIAVTLMLEFAMRNGDAGRLRWADLRERDGARFLTYTPHKTSLSSGRVVAWPIHETIWDRLRQIRDTGRDRAGTHFHGLVLPAADEVFSRLNKEIRERCLFTGTHKGCYELRKICIDHVYQKYGAEMASSISGDDIRTVTRYYADPSAVNIHNVRIVDLL